MAELVGENCIASSSDVVKFWDLKTFAELSQTNPFPHHTQVELSSLSWNSNGQFIASTDTSGKEISIITYGSTEKPNLYSHKEDVGYTCASFFSSSRYLVAGSKQSLIHLWDLKNRNVVRSYKGHSSSLTSLSVHSKDSYLASGSSNGTLLLHRKDSSQLLASLSDSNGQAITRVKFSPLEKSLLATTTIKGALSLWSAESLRLLVGFKAAHSGKATDACFSPFNNMLLASAGLDGRIVFYDVISRKIVSDTPLPGPITSLLMIRDGKTIVAGGSDGMIYACDMRSHGTPYASVKAHDSRVTCLSLPGKASRLHSSVKRTSSVPVSSTTAVVTPMVLPTPSSVSTIPECSIITPPPSTIPRPQFTSDLFSPLPGDSSQSPKVLAAVGPTVKGHRSDASPLLVASSWTAGVTEPQVTPATLSGATGSTTSVASQDLSSVSLHSSTEEREAVIAPSSELPSVDTALAHQLPVQTTAVEETDSGLVQPPAANFHVQFLENIVQDSMEELKYSLHRDMRYMYADFLRQLSVQGYQQQLQLNRIESLLTNEINSLREENHRLQQENTRLKTLY